MSTRIKKDSVDHFFDYNLHLESRTIYVSGEIDYDTVNPALKGLHLITQDNKERSAAVVMTTEGGSWNVGIALYDAIKSRPFHVDVIAMGQCMSMGSIILQAGDKRILHKHTTIMIHDGTEEFGGNVRSFAAWGEFSKIQLQQMYNIYAERSGKKAIRYRRKPGTHCAVSCQGLRSL